jgi:drug/metabolite transporter (DMT)-like permease
VSHLAFLGVLLAALLHAGWNAVIKSGADKGLDIALFAICAGLIATAGLPFAPHVAVESWPYIVASVALEQIYYLLLVAAYRKGDMSEAYPLMRGIAPLLVAIAGGSLIGESLPLQRWIGVALICSGALSMAFEAHRLRHARSSAAPFAIANAFVIAAYTLIDGIGVRKSAAPAAYTMWIFALGALPILAWVLFFRRSEIVRYARHRLHLGLLGGAATVGSYGLVLSAMTLAPIALVAALRETSILFATVIAVVFLRERIGWMRYLAIALIALGAVTIRLT